LELEKKQNKATSFQEALISGGRGQIGGRKEASGMGMGSGNSRP
jgi:hypothetical protein